MQPPAAMVDWRIEVELGELEETTMMTVPSVFISYSWDSDDHKEWVKRLATRLRSDGVKTELDQWELVPGDRLPHFMERSIRDNQYVLVICTPAYKARSDARIGGAGYEGDIMTAELLGGAVPRKFIPVLRSQNREAAIPSWLGGRYYIDLTEPVGSEEHERQYHDMVATLHGERERAPEVRPRSPGAVPPSHRPDGAKRTANAVSDHSIDQEEHIRILGIIADEVTLPRNDGTAGSALYRVPFRLSRAPSYAWVQRFIAAWDSPPRFSPLHRRGIARVVGDKIILDGTTLDEVKQVHRDTLLLAVDVVNKRLAEEREESQRRTADAARRQEEHRKAAERAAKEIKFD